MILTWKESNDILPLCVFNFYSSEEKHFRYNHLSDNPDKTKQGKTKLCLRLTYQLRALDWKFFFQAEPKVNQAMFGTLSKLVTFRDITCDMCVYKVNKIQICPDFT